MRTEVRISRQLYEAVLADLRRPHPFAFERVGFLVGRTCASTESLRLILLWRYVSIPDEDYMEDRSVGARIGEKAMSAAMKIAFDGRGSKDGVFHVHLHEMSGPTGMSKTDAEELPAMMPGFSRMGSSAAHGIVILSSDHGSAWLWHPDGSKNVCANRLVVIGAPVVMMEEGKKW